MNNLELLKNLQKAPKSAKVYIGSDFFEEKNGIRIMSLEGIHYVDFFNEAYSSRSSLPIVKRLENDLVIFQSERGIDETLTVDQVLSKLNKIKEGKVYSGVLVEKGEIVNFSLYDTDESVFLEKIYASKDNYGNELVELNDVFVIVKDV